MSRYIVETEHVRGEPRIYWVEDTSKRYGRSYAQVTDHTTDQRKARRWCDEMNTAAMSPADRGTPRYPDAISPEPPENAQ